MRRNVSVTEMSQVALLSVTQPEYGRELLRRLVPYSCLHGLRTRIRIRSTYNSHYSGSFSSPSIEN